MCVSGHVCVCDVVRMAAVSHMYVEENTAAQTTSFPSFPPHTPLDLFGAASQLKTMSDNEGHA